jgi:predicted aldo/keto reductase-like oxidoreductase
MSSNQSRRTFIGAGLGAPVLFATTSRIPEKNTTSPAFEAPPKLSYRTLGKTGLKVTTLGFGSMITSDGTVLERAADLGINYFDTARGYQNGNCERMVGAALKSRRKQLYIATKSHTRTKQGALDDLDTSLRELQTDYVDVWHLHAIGNAGEITDELLEAQNEAKKAGKIRFAGFSCHTGHKEVVAAALAKKHFDVALLSYNFTMGATLDETIGAASEAGLGVIGMKVMAGGLRAAAKEGSEKTRDILKRDGAMLAALKWNLKNPNVHTTIPSITDMDQLDENRRVMSESFNLNDGKLLAARLERISPEYCRMCNECLGQCRYDLPVADLHRFLMYSENYGEFALGREQFQLLPAGLRQVRCSDCSKCTVRCPYGVRIVDRLSRAQEYFA